MAVWLAETESELNAVGTVADAVLEGEGDAVRHSDGLDDREGEGDSVRHSDGLGVREGEGEEVKHSDGLDVREVVVVTEGLAEGVRFADDAAVAVEIAVARVVTDELLVADAGELSDGCGEGVTSLLCGSAARAQRSRTMSRSAISGSSTGARHEQGAMTFALIYECQPASQTALSESI